MPAAVHFGPRTKLARFLVHNGPELGSKQPYYGSLQVAEIIMQPPSQRNNGNEDSP